jgi:hypothetical protein
MKTKLPGKHHEQAAGFISVLHETGWHTLTCFVDGGHAFELLSKGTKTLLVQLYPEGHGFQVWRPITESSSIAETALACAAYGGEIPQRAATPVRHETEKGQE